MYRKYVAFEQREGGFSLEETLDEGFCGFEGTPELTMRATTPENMTEDLPPWAQVPAIGGTGQRPRPWWAATANAAKARNLMKMVVESIHMRGQGLSNIPFLCWFCGSRTHTYHWCIVCGPAGRCWNCELFGHRSADCPMPEGYYEGHVAVASGGRRGQAPSSHFG